MANRGLPPSGLWRRAGKDLSRKQAIYFSILEATLPYIRNFQAGRLRWRILDDNVLPEAELVAKMHRLLLRSDFHWEDVVWRFGQAQFFREVRSSLPLFKSDVILGLIDEIDELLEFHGDPIFRPNSVPPPPADDEKEMIEGVTFPSFLHCYHEEDISRKQEIYFLIFEHVFPAIRDVQAWPLWRRILYGDVYPEAELVHYLHHLVFRPEVVKEDVWWLTCQGWAFKNARCRKPFARSDVIIDLLDELDELFKRQGPWEDYSPYRAYSKWPHRWWSS